MSELYSLFVKVKISKDQLHKFKSSRPVAPALNSSWTNWWDSREMYDKHALQVVQSYYADSYGQVIQGIIDEKFSGSQELYDPNSGIWYFYVLQFSENYQEIIPMMAMLKDLAHYLEPEATGHAFLYDYMWESKEVMFEITYQNKEAKLTSAARLGQLPAEVVNEANQILEAWSTELQKRYED